MILGGINFNFFNLFYFYFNVFLEYNININFTNFLIFNLIFKKPNQSIFKWVHVKQVM